MVRFGTIPSNVTAIGHIDATFECAIHPTTSDFSFAWWFKSFQSHQTMLVWTNDEQGVRLANHSISMIDERNITLFVHNVQLQNRGIYTCRVISGGLTIEASASLEVFCKLSRSYSYSGAFEKKHPT